MNVSPLLLVSVLAVCSLGWSGCATSPEPVIVQRVDAAETPVKAVVLANDHLFAVLTELEPKVDGINSTEELVAVAARITEAVRGSDRALKRLLTINTVTPEEDAQLKAVFARSHRAAPKWRRMYATLRAKGERAIGDPVVLSRGTEAIYWMGEFDETLQRVQRKPYHVKAADTGVTGIN